MDLDEYDELIRSHVVTALCVFSHESVKEMPRAVEILESWVTSLGHLEQDIFNFLRLRFFSLCIANQY